MLARTLSMLATATLVLGSHGAPASAADYFAGKTLTVVVGLAAGGGVDANARAMTRHLGRFIPGQPNIIVQNMEGAAGVVSVNHLSRRVAPDGLTLGVPGRSWFIDAIVKKPGINFDPTKFTYIGSPGAAPATGYVHKSTGITTYEQLKASKKIVTFGALGPSTATAMSPALLAASGVPIKVVLGYVATARVLLALEQREIDGSFTVGNALSTRKELFNQVTPIVQTGTVWPGVPYIGDVIRPELKPVLELVMAPETIGVPLIGPPGVPADVTAILRKAFMAMAQDKDFQADAERVDLPVGSPISGEQILAKMHSLVELTTPEVMEQFRKLSSGK